MKKVTVELEDRHAAFLARKVTEHRKSCPELSREEVLSLVLGGLLQYWMTTDLEDLENPADKKA